MQQAGLADDDDEEIWVKEEDDEEEEDGYYMDPRSPAVWTPGGRAGGTSNRRRAREEKERTKMRERQRRAITGRILAGLRQHGNYRLRARADINEVIAALAREAGWVVLPDGTTFPSSSSFAAVAAQVVMSFHECGGNVGDDISIPLPHWVIEIGRSNPDIYFTDRAGRRNTECLSWGVDKERVLQGRTAVEVYFDFMRSFRVEFDEYFEDGIISEIEIGLGACGELRYPSYPAKHGWKYPGIGEFQCYDRYLQKSLRKAAEARGHTIWARGPDNAGHYNSEPNLTGFFCDGGDYDSYYGRFFLSWYSQALVDHADRVLMLARLAFEGTNIAVKVSGVHWWYKTASHAAELTAGFYNPCNRDGYAPIAAVLKKYDAALNFTCVELRTMDQHEVYPEAFADPEGLVWQVLNAAWDAGIQVASENALPCYDRDGFNKILENAKPLNDPDGRHLLGFTYLRLGKDLFERPNFFEFERFIKRMHGGNIS
ncbi:Beta-amylase 2 chloroplastic [Zea mays]|uniref:Beta-amylase n=1 Tax=Zea mays TaxID=4577 RepID=A0A1D6I097_MAIZE|nr:Beta-amylase 2 chloroplastic [Zea mays]